MKIVTAETNGTVIQETLSNLVRSTENLLEAIDEVKDLGVDDKSLEYLNELEDSVSPIVNNSMDIVPLNKVKMYF